MQARLSAYLTYIIWTVKVRLLYQSIKKRGAGMLAKYGSSNKQIRNTSTP
jgi:hypothetical protein